MQVQRTVDAESTCSNWILLSREGEVNLHNVNKCARAVTIEGMPLWSPRTFEVDAGLDERLQRLPNHPAVFLIHARTGRPYFGRTSQLRRRLTRLLGQRTEPSRWLNFRDPATRVEVQFTASWLETNLVYYTVVRALHAETYRAEMRLRLPPYLKVGLTNAFPRCYISTRFAASQGFWYGPFRSRAAAEHFEEQLGDLFQIRRCLEDLSPSPDHPGCIYGEMNLCLRPCQQIVGPDEYSSEVARLIEFLSSGGRSLVGAVTHSRDQLSAELKFEEARRLHRQLEKIEQVLRLRDDLARKTDQLHGVAVTRSVEESSVELWFVVGGGWLPPIRFRVEASADKSISLDQRLREIAATLRPPKLTLSEREDHLALLARWYYSTFRDGEWLPFEQPGSLPYRKLVRAISRVASEAASSSPAGSRARPPAPGGVRGNR